MKLPIFSYSYHAGPLPEAKLNENIKVGNCRLSVQLYFYLNHQIYFSQKNILNPNAYRNTGEFIFRSGEEINPVKLKIGDVIYAEKINGQKEYKNENDHLISLHSAIYLDSQSIYHATVFENKSCLWSLAKFLQHYKIIAIKRFLQ